MDIYTEITTIRERVKDLERIEQPARSGGLPVYPALTAGSVLFAGTGGVLAQDNANLFWDDTNNRLTVTGFVLLGAGTSFPASPPTNGVYHRTDLGFLCYYDGTRWLTFDTFAYQLNPVAFSANNNQIIAPIRTDYAPYITRVAVAWIVATTNNGSNYWTFTLRGVNSNYTLATNIHSDNTSGGAANTWAIGDAAPSATAVPSNKSAFDIAVSKTAGAPGNITIAATIYSRLIIT